jgi:hypothetical protein
MSMDIDILEKAFNLFIYSPFKRKIQKVYNTIIWEKNKYRQIILEKCRNGVPFEAAREQSENLTAQAGAVADAIIDRKSQHRRTY